MTEAKAMPIECDPWKRAEKAEAELARMQETLHGNLDAAFLDRIHDLEAQRDDLKKSLEDAKLECGAWKQQAADLFAAANCATLRAKRAEAELNKKVAG